MQIADDIGGFIIVVLAPHQEFLEGTTYGESTVYQIIQKLYRNEWIDDKVSPTLRPRPSVPAYN